MYRNRLMFLRIASLFDAVHQQMAIFNTFFGAVCITRYEIIFGV